MVLVLLVLFLFAVVKYLSRPLPSTPNYQITTIYFIVFYFVGDLLPPTGNK